MPARLKGHCPLVLFADMDFDRAQENHTDEAHKIGNFKEVQEPISSSDDGVMGVNRTLGNVWITVIFIIKCRSTFGSHLQ